MPIFKFFLLLNTDKYVNNIQIQIIMAQKKGQTGNPNGRPKGSPNKTSAEIRNLFQTLIQNNIEHLQSDFEEIINYKLSKPTANRGSKSHFRSFCL